MGITTSAYEAKWQIFAELLYSLDDAYASILESRPLLAHYTSISCVREILKSEQIWFSHPLFMNDLEELRLGMSEGKSIVTKYVNDVLTHRWPQISPLVMNIFEKNVKGYEETDLVNTYVFCLTQHSRENVNGKLSMWRAYGGRGSGAAIVFNTSLITPDASGPLRITKVNYGTTDDRRVWLLNALSRGLSALDKVGMDAQVATMFGWFLFMLLMHFSLTWKHDGFREEEEWRVIYLPLHDDNRSLEKHFSYGEGRQGLEPKLKLPVRPIREDALEAWNISSIIQHIILGPTASSGPATTAFKRMLNEIGQSELTDKVLSSYIPLRFAD